MADVEEITNEEITREHVEKRIRDWRVRIEDLFRQIIAWLPAGWEPVEQTQVTMDEEMMRRFGIPSERLPVLNLKSSGGHTAKYEPRALWVIGANGRVDVFAGKSHYILVDKAPQFREPEWHFSDIRSRRDLKPLDHEAVARMLDEAAS